MAGFDPISLMVISSIGTSAAGTAFNMFSANEAAKVRERGIRAQQTAARLQETEADLENMDNLQKVLARQEVMAGTRNIGVNSGSLAALTRDTFNQYDRINDMNKFNANSKKIELTNASLANSMEKRNNMVKAGLGFAESALGAGSKYKSLMDLDAITKRSTSIAPQGAY
jgi:hypothetical protein